MTPYKAQREVLKELIRGTDAEIFFRPGTVYAFQGLEFDASIFDLVESLSLPIAPFLRGGWGSGAMWPMNVAVTRARHKLILVANLDYIHQEPHYSTLRQVTELAYQKKVFLPCSFLYIRKKIKLPRNVFGVAHRSWN